MTSMGSLPDEVLRILFLDEDNRLLGPMAAAIGRKNYPGSGDYQSAGRAHDTVDADLGRLIHARRGRLG